MQIQSNTGATTAIAKKIHQHRKITVHIDIERKQLKPSRPAKILISSYVSAKR